MLWAAAERRILSRPVPETCTAVTHADRPDAATLQPAQRALQAELLQRVSRTFALTIPKLTAPLADVVGNGYLLCRLVDTIEDELPATSSAAERKGYFVRFNEILDDPANGDAVALSTELSAALRAEAPAGERLLVERLSDVVAMTARFDEVERASLSRCVRTMGNGMHSFESGATSTAGLANVTQLEHYCYHVAGVVGEMLTTLFCHHSPAIDARRDALVPLAVPFGYGLQLTNILKDAWDDHERGVCWLPRDVFGSDDTDLRALFTDAAAGSPVAIAQLDAGLAELIGLCRGWLDDAVRYVSTLPRSEHGVRVFCLWSVSMAVLTLRKVHARRSRDIASGAKITRNSVRVSLLLSDLCARNDHLLRVVHQLGSRGLPAATRRDVPPLAGIETP